VNQVTVVGGGNWGKNLIRNFYQLNALSGIVEVDSQKQAQYKIDYPNLNIYTDYQEALKTDSSAIVIATPAPTHYQLAKTALEAGKDVFVEKPMTLKAKEAKSLAEYADRCDRILMVGHLLLYQPAITWMREHLDTGKAGKVLHVATIRTKLGRVRKEENVWWSFAPHDISVVLHLLGNPEVKKINAQGQAILQPGIEDNVHVDLTFQDDKTAHIHCSWYHPLWQRSTIVIAEKQMLVYDEVSQTVTVYDKSIDRNTLNNIDEGSTKIDIAASEPLKLECEHFLNCLETRTKPLSDGWNGVAVVEILEQAQKALENRLL
jgi:predicted dehydrogenase